MQSVIMLTVVIFYCYAECRYAECHYAECRGAKPSLATVTGLFYNTTLRK